ncbi:MAG: hypothetical protein Q8Q76_13235 [Methylotenera sp.]|nr:hypothetical protein [Methylotenera sp.]
MQEQDLLHHERATKLFPHCQWRLDIIKNIVIENEAVQVNYCHQCNIEVLMIE